MNSGNELKKSILNITNQYDNLNLDNILKDEKSI